MRLLHSLLPLLILAVFNSQSLAQPIGTTHYSVESLISPAVLVAIGTIKSVEEKTPTPPNPGQQRNIWPERGEAEHVVVTQFDEILKKIPQAKIPQAGDAGEFEKLTLKNSEPGSNDRLADWAREKTVGLWLVYPKSDTEKFHRWSFIPLKEQGVTRVGYSSLAITPPMLARDLSILTTSKEILKRIREYCSISQAEQKNNSPDNRNIQTTASASFPSTLFNGFRTADYNYIVLPYDSELPKTVRRLIESPRSFKTKPINAEWGGNTLNGFRLAGIGLLGQMKTESSIKLLEKCLDESKLPFDNDPNATFIRTRAYEQLLKWQVNPSRPKFSDEIQQLLLSDKSINDDTLALISENVNLRSLYLSEAKVSHLGVEHLAKLHKLNELYLNNSLLTDEMMQTLFKNDQLHAIRQAGIEGSSDRPASADEVTGLDIFYAPLTDAGLSKFLRFQNLVTLRLGRMKITDQAIDTFAQFKDLKLLELSETQVTENGIARLKKLLPSCKIDFR